MRFTCTGRDARGTDRLTLRSRFTLIVLNIAICLIAGSVVFAGPSLDAPSSTKRFFANTGHSVEGAFLGFYETYGGVSIFGYPISDPIDERGRTVQYFERQRFEYHAEAAGTPNEVQLSRLGAELAPPGAMGAYPRPFDSLSNWVYFPESKHSLKSPFLEYWKAKGSLRLFGYPVTEALTENGLLVQYFERARMEYHPEIKPASNAVQLGLLGRLYLKAHPDIAARVSGDKSRVGSSRGSEPAPASQPQQRTRLEAEQNEPLNSKEALMLANINLARQEQGMQPVQLDDKLRSIALSRSQDMVNRSYFSHTTPDGVTFLDMLAEAKVPYKWAGEIIANNNYPENETTEQAYNGFVNSPHHHEIMMSPRYNMVGVGEAMNANGFHYFTVIFTEQ